MTVASRRKGPPVQPVQGRLHLTPADAAADAADADFRQAAAPESPQLNGRADPSWMAHAADCAAQHAEKRRLGLLRLGPKGR